MNLPDSVDYYEQYSTRWKGYRRLWPNLDLRERKVLDLLESVLPGSRILDIGCGDALLGRFICERHAVQYVGLDASRRTLQLAQLNLAGDTRPRLIQGDALHLGLAPATFDVIIMGELIEHFQFPSYLMTEARRVARPGARIIVTTPNYASLAHRIGLLLRGRIAFDVEEHVRLFTYRSLKEFLHHNGLQVQRIEGVFYVIDMPWPLIQLNSQRHFWIRRLQRLEHRLLGWLPSLAGWLIADCTIQK